MIEISVGQVKDQKLFIEATVRKYVESSDSSPLFLEGDAVEVLSHIPSGAIDFCMTSPPYWGKRSYDGGGIGLESTYQDYIESLLEIFAEVYRVLKPAGSFWLNIGDSYDNKRLLGIPWRVAIEMMDRQGWILRNNVIWNKVKGGLDNSIDKLANTHEDVFHFVKNKSYYYDIDSIRSKPKATKVVKGAVVSATGVSGVRYRRQIELSTALSDVEKSNAFKALEETLTLVRNGDLADFRMIIRGQQRTTHSDSTTVSGRAKELQARGFYFLKYHPKGSKPGDVWDIIPEDTQGRGKHYAAYPEDLCKTPIIATCPPGGIVLDPLCGTGTTMYAAQMLGRKSIGIDISRDYIAVAKERCQQCRISG